MSDIATTTPANQYNLREHALALLIESTPQIKCGGLANLLSHFQQNKVLVDTTQFLTTTKTIPGCPAKPVLVSPRGVKRRAMNTIEGRAALIHALAHIEFNAVNLALDAVWRFADMPARYYEDWLKVASEEACHFGLLNSHLHHIGYEYGSFDAHNSLWEMVDKTKADVLVRMALVPRTMEARGLDASPALRAKLTQAGDHAAADILTIILRDEIGHVAIGNIWYNWLCEQRGLEPVATFKQLCAEYEAPKLKPPFNMEARREAGFSDAELALL
ncbi:MAG: ferritin-like domain-containing protein [Methylophilaceae bacterium]|nr:ferritin-like domain-containing protein [Methylophilaceae bacterium]